MNRCGKSSRQERWSLPRIPEHDLRHDRVRRVDLAPSAVEFRKTLSIPSEHAGEMCREEPIRRTIDCVLASTRMRRRNAWSNLRSYGTESVANLGAKLRARPSSPDYDLVDAAVVVPSDRQPAPFPISREPVFCPAVVLEFGFRRLPECFVEFRGGVIGQMWTTVLQFLPVDCRRIDFHQAFLGNVFEIQIILGAATE